MVRDPSRIRWSALDPFRAQKEQAIREFEVKKQATEPKSHEEESTAILVQVERVLLALERHDQNRRGLFLKLVLAWVVAYSLTLGETPWVFAAFWRGVTAAFGG